jgi:flavocytochrome c
MTEMNRRTLIKGAFGTAALMGMASLHAKEVKQWDETVDVVVVGSGFAGLAAAIEAKKAGGNVIVIDKMPTAGGNSIINGGLLAATGCPQQKKHGIKDSIDLFEKDILVAGNYMNDRKKVRYLVEHTLSNYEWCVNELGVEFNQESIGQEGGHSVPRYVATKNGSGSGIVTKELEKCKALGVPVRLRTYVESIVRNDSGKVEGVVVRTGYRFPKADSGKVRTIRATKGVVLCYGGFSADVRYRMFQDPKLNEKLDTTNQPGATSELWCETSAIGCLQVQNDWIQCGPWGNPKEKGMGIGWEFNQSGAAEFGIWVNSDGQRFVNELANRKVRADAIMVQQQLGKRCWAICNEPNTQPLRRLRPGNFEKMLDRKIVEKYDTVDDLAKACGISANGLKKQIADFNAALEAKSDKQFGRYINKEELPLKDGPWYVGELQPKVHHCMGGLVTDLNCRVLDVKTFKPIPGLYAAGEATSGVHGAVRLGTVAILDCLVFGRTAGQSVMKG